MNLFKVRYSAGARRVEIESFELWIPVIFKQLIETDSDTGNSKTVSTVLDYSGKPCWSEERARTNAINIAQRKRN